MLHVVLITGNYTISGLDKRESLPDTESIPLAVITEPDEECPIRRGFQLLLGFRPLHTAHIPDLVLDFGIHVVGYGSPENDENWMTTIEKGRIFYVLEAVIIWWIYGLFIQLRLLQ